MFEVRGFYMGVQRFEDLDCWKAARELVKTIYRLAMEPVFSRDFGLRDQVQKASVSVMANIAEGFGAMSNPEFIRFLGIAGRSATEVQSHLYVALDLDYIDQVLFAEGYARAQECLNRCKAFIKYLKEV